MRPVLLFPMRCQGAFFVACALAALIAAPLAPANATTKGLNQIVTPDVQPEGQLSLSFQQQDPNIANRREIQAELGLTKTFEVAVFEGTSPGEQIWNAELGLVAKGPYMLSTGFANWLTKGTAPQPYLEAGYYKGNIESMIGVARVVSEDMGVGGAVRSFHETQGIVGAAYRVSPRTLVQLDYQAGAGNFSTAGFTYNITPQLQFNPSLYISNTKTHKGYGYAVLTWNIAAFH